MENSIQFIQITPEQLEERIVSGISKIIDNVIKPSSEEELLSRTEAAKFLGISTVTLWDWTNKKKITSYGISNKVFYKKSELLASLVPLNG